MLVLWEVVEHEECKKPYGYYAPSGVWVMRCDVAVQRGHTPAVHGAAGAPRVRHAPCTVRRACKMGRCGRWEMFRYQRLHMVARVGSFYGTVRRWPLGKKKHVRNVILSYMINK